MIPDAYIIIAVSVASALLTEFVNWFFIYRHDSYKSLKKEVEALAKKVEKKKEEVVDFTKQKSKEKRTASLEDQLKHKNRELSFMTTKSSLIMAVALFAIYNVLSSNYYGIVVAKLPFEPFSLIRNITHMNLPGTDFTHCSFTFIFVLCNFGVRPTISKLFGFAPKQKANNNGWDSFLPQPDAALPRRQPAARPPRARMQRRCSSRS